MCWVISKGNFIAQKVVVVVFKQIEFIILISCHLKGAVCRVFLFVFLTILKHKNTICLQRFIEHANFTYLFLWKTMLQPVILLWNVCSMLECLFLFWSVWSHPLPIYPIVFQLPGLPVGGKTQHTADMEASKQIGSEIADSTWPKKPKKLYVQRHIKQYKLNWSTYSGLSLSTVNCACSCCFSSIWQPAWASSLLRRGWEK